MMTIKTNAGDVTVRTRQVGRQVLAQAFSDPTGRTPIWQQDFPAGTVEAAIETECRAYLVDNTSLLDGMA